MWSLTRMVASWGYVPGLLVSILAGVFILLGIQFCQSKPRWSLWPSIMALVILSSHVVLYLFQSTGWTIWYTETQQIRH